MRRLINRESGVTVVVADDAAEGLLASGRYTPVEEKPKAAAKRPAGKRKTR
ncbi:DUF7302 family protein [Corynebacterium parakroppenstedtii]|uniref:DUF7302 family protein n=1 Tax=Corynebacterium parakroppenstedtii TaxID=2828363 RepID=UPI001C8E4AF3|nr:hypothetical protein [Corynebacterium parakroppenstedtii]MBY0797869.1 hypothetical protein [Corynebacterium parakroppenstedtii]